MQKYDIQVTFTVIAKDEQEAEHNVSSYLRVANEVMDAPDITNWEFTEFVPSDLKNSCCC